MEKELQQPGIVSLWLHWYFLEVPGGILRAFGNFLKFYFHYFSISLLLRTLFSYWRRYRWSYGRGFDLKRYLSTFISNTVSRFLGALIRSVTILVGLIFELLVLITGIIILLFWICLPIILIFGFYFGFKLAFLK